jgi:ATP-dependent protease ClpP protease subunit
MPTRTDIIGELVQRQSAASDDIRRKYLQSLFEHTHRNTIIYASSFQSKKTEQIPSSYLSITGEDINGFMSAIHGLKGKELDLIIHSPGGSLEATEQIVQYLRSKFEYIRAIVPTNAMSAATMLACACDEIVMGKHSAIGPIDPQMIFQTATGQFSAPAQAILDEFEQAKESIKKDPSTAILWVNKIKDYPPGFLNMCSTTIELSKSKVKEWLTNFMFKSDPKKEEKAQRISDWLANFKEHKTHGRPISILQAKDIGLNVSEMEKNQEFQEKVLSVFHAVMMTFESTNCIKFIENQDGKGLFSQITITISSKAKVA